MKKKIYITIISINIHSVSLIKKVRSFPTYLLFLTVLPYSITAKINRIIVIAKTIINNVIRRLYGIISKPYLVPNNVTW